MSIGTKLHDYLLGVAAVSAIIGTKIFPVHAIKVAAPYVTFRKIAPGREYTHDSDADGDHPTYEVSAYASTFAVARDLADKLILALEAWPDEAGDISALFLRDEEEIFNYNVELYQVLISCEIWPQEV